MKLTAAFLFALGITLSSCMTMTKTPEQEVEEFMWAYTRAWNKHDAPTLARDFYRIGDRTVEQQTESFKKQFADLVAQGYTHSDIYEIKGCPTGADTAWAGMKFSRLKKDGGFVARDRASSYTLKKFADGWRIVSVGGGDFAKPLECPKA